MGEKRKAFSLMYIYLEVYTLLSHLLLQHKANLSAQIDRLLINTFIKVSVFLFDETSIKVLNRVLMYRIDTLQGQTLPPRCHESLFIRYQALFQTLFPQVS